MNTRRIAAEYRLSYWAGIMRERRESGLSVKAFCKDAGFHENIYYYWQKKLRENACEQLGEYQAEQTASGFAEVKVKETTMLQVEETASRICVEVGRYKITADNAYPVESIATLLREVKGIC